MVRDRTRDCRFDPQQERRENFLVQGQLSALTLVLYPSPPRIAAVTRKRSRPFCQRCRCQVTAMHVYIHLFSVNVNVRIVKKLCACIKQEQERHSGGKYYCQGTGPSEVAGGMTIAVGYIPPKHRTPSTFKSSEGCSLTSIIITDHFYIALFSALKQTHCARM